MLQTSDGRDGKYHVCWEERPSAAVREKQSDSMVTRDLQESWQDVGQMPLSVGPWERMAAPPPPRVFLEGQAEGNALHNVYPCAAACVEAPCSAACVRPRAPSHG